MLLQLARPLAVFDLETTGIRVGKDRIVQIGIVRMMPDGTRESWQSLVNPGMPIPAEATAVHGISDPDVAMAPRLEDLADEVLDLLSGCDLSGFNVIRFDVPFLSEELHRVGKAWDNSSARIVDVQRIYHKMERRDLGAAVKFFLDREHIGAHDALADVEATADVLLAQLARYTELPHDVGQLGDFSGDRERSPDAAGKLKYDEHGHACLGFGKYSGWSLENIGKHDPGYLQWLMTKAELPGSTMAVMKRVLASIEA